MINSLADVLANEIQGCAGSRGIYFAGDYASCLIKKLFCLRVSLKDGRRYYAKLATSRNGKVLPFKALVDGQVERNPEGVYALRYWEHGRVIYRQVGTDYDAAQTARLRLKLELRTNEVAAATAAPTMPVPLTVPVQSAAATEPASAGLSILNG